MKQQVFTYPGSDLDRSRTLIAALGSFWLRTFTGRDQLTSYVNATAYTVAETHRKLLAVVAALSRYDVPLFDEKTLVPITIKKSQLNTLATNSDKFDTTLAHFDDGTFFDAVTNKTFFAYPAPSKLASVEQLFNKITFPTAMLDKNVDFVVDPITGVLIFNRDPFDNVAFLRHAAGPGDEEITLWGFCGKFDYDIVFNQFAYAVGIKLQSSQGYKDLINAIVDGLVDGGATAAALDLAFAAICGIPVSTEPVETVEIMDYDNRGFFIATDKTVYRFNETVEPRVGLGQVITAGTMLIRGIDISEFFVGNKYAELNAPDVAVRYPPSNAVLADNIWKPLLTETDENLRLDPNLFTCRKTRKDLAALALDGGFLSACFYSDLIFENKPLPLEVNTAHPSGYTYLHFGLGGLPADVERFFDEIHYRGIQAAKLETIPCQPNHKRRGTLAHLLDARVHPATEPDVTHLPKTINPLQFLVENVLRNNVFVVRILVSALGQNSLGLYNIRHLRQLLPPQTAMIVIFELAPGMDTVNGADNVRETLNTFTGMARQLDKVPVSLLHDLGATARIVSGTCQ
jgi:hypothetical protein